MKNETRGRDIFYGVVAVATLIVAIVGATLAYFSISVSSNEGAVNAMSAKVSIDYEDGKQVTAQADEMIPADFETVVKKVYEERVKTSTLINPTTNACIDDKDQQVCSVYRFTVTSNITRQISATLNNEENGFKSLSYALYEVDEEDPNGGEWVEISDTNYLNLTTCSNENADPEDDCHKLEKEKKIYDENRAVNSIFGYTTETGGTVKNALQELKVAEGATEARKTYDLIIFIRETNVEQNEDQGKKYVGTIKVDVTDGTSDQITGYIDPSKE